jgi:3-hydroxyacyl-CoA dehydrogenase
MKKLSDSVSYEVRGRVGLILIDKPPVNAIDYSIRTGLVAAIEHAARDAAAGIVLLACAGRTYMAGADISEFEGELKGPHLIEVLQKVEDCPKPVATVLFGTALGGGLETALACHYRAAVSSARMGLPELSLGVIPGAGGTQRMPRLIGARATLDMVLGIRPLGADEARKIGIIDEIVVGDSLEAGLKYAERLLARRAKVRRTSEGRVDATGFDDAGIAAALETHAKALKGRTTQHLLIEALKAAATLPFAEGMKVERRLGDKSIATAESKALRHLFFAERLVAKVPGLPKDRKAPALNVVAVVGAGTMGSGIATSFANAGLDVVLIDADDKGLARGVELVQSNYDTAIRRGIMTSAQAAENRGRIEAVVGTAAAKSADLVVEAVFEDMDLKKRVLGELDKLVPKHAVLASNTSTLSVTELGRSTSRPDKVVGLHFFSPAHVMKLLEIVRGDNTSPDTLVIALDVAKKLRKIGVVAGDGYGFIGNRMMLDGYWRENEQLLLEGATPEQADRILEEWGFAMGPNKVNDMGGVDVGTKARQQLFKREKRPAPYFVVSDALTLLGRLGQKTGKGVYRYEKGDRTPHPDPEVAALIEKLAAEHGIKRRKIADAEIEERCVLSLINVGAMVLEEGIAYRASDIDIVWTSGYGFPRHKGGPMFYADALGLKHVLERVRHYHAKLGHYWKPATLLVELAESGAAFADWDRQHAR